jgi:ankyrin repeat protein
MFDYSSQFEKNLESPDPNIEYWQTCLIKSKGWTLLHKLVLFPDLLEKYLEIKSRPDDKNDNLNADNLNLNSKTTNGWTPLFLALSQTFHGDGDMYKIVKLLLESGADPNIANYRGETPLMTENSLYKAKFTKLLLDNGADVNRETNDRKTVFDFLLYKNTGPCMFLVRAYLKTLSLDAQVELARESPLETMKKFYGSWYPNATKEDYDLYTVEPPHISVQLAAVKVDGTCIVYIKNPSEEIQLAAIKQTGKAFREIRGEMSEKVKLAAIKKLAVNISWIDNQTDEMKWIALKKSHSVFRDIKNPTNEMKLYALKKNGLLLKHITDQTDEMKFEAEKQNPKASKFVK